MKKILLLLITIPFMGYGQTTNENISQLKDKSGDVYFRITKSDSIYKFEFAQDSYERHVSRDKYNGLMITNDVDYEYLELDTKFILKDSFSLLTMYNGINNMFLSLPEKKQDYTRESRDSIFPLITLSVDSLICVWSCNSNICLYSGYFYSDDYCKKYYKKLCAERIGLQFRGGQKNAEVCFWSREENGEQVWSRWMTKKELKLLLKKQVWQK